jgi:tellurite resistance protein TehA-like permease
MTLKKYRQIKNSVLIFLSLIILISLSLQLFLLTGFSVLTFILFLSLISSKNQKIFDEREVNLRQQATDFTFTIFLSTISVSSFLMLIPSYSGLSVFFPG